MSAFLSACFSVPNKSPREHLEHGTNTVAAFALVFYTKIYSHFKVWPGQKKTFYLH